MARALGLADVAADDNFFALGGDSLRAVELLAIVADELHRELSPSILIGAPTPRQLTAALGTVGPAQAASSDPILLREGFGRPIFFTPGLGGDAFALRLLAGRMRTTQPIYGFRAVGLDPAQRPHDTSKPWPSTTSSRRAACSPTGRSRSPASRLAAWSATRWQPGFTLAVKASMPWG